MINDHFPKPKIVVSECLGFSRCRWNGEIIEDDFLRKLGKFVATIKVCPECAIGLGVPRDPIRLVLKGSDLRLLQLNTGKELTEIMRSYAVSFLEALDGIDGFILKDRSPSCGIKDVKVYPGLGPSSAIKKGSGFFASEVLKMFPGAAAESEARLSNQEIREQFLTRIFTWARFREARKKGQMRDLISFHAHHKFLLMTYAQNDLVSLGHLVANQDKKKPGSVFGSYERLLRKALRRPPSAPSAINVLMHGFGYFSKKLLREERQFFLNTLEEYRREQIPLSVPISLLRSYAVRFNEAYINQQVFLRPFPETLLELRDSRRGR